jgi:cell division protein FtsB
MQRFNPYKPYKEKNPIRLPVLLVLALLLLWMLLSPYGLWRYGKISRELKALQQENHLLEAENRQFRQDIDRLQNDPGYIEEVARREHGLLRKNEIIFDFTRR